MPGSSLWLLPPSDHPLKSILPTLISQTSNHFNSPHSFIPHITLTSEIPPSLYGSDPQAWLDSLALPEAGDMQVTFEELCSEDVFVRKLYIRCDKTDKLMKLGAMCRQTVGGFEDETKAEKWAKEAYNPHLSLLYHDCPKVDASGLEHVEKLARKLDVDFEGHGDLSGWKGGRIILVPTDKPIDQWIRIAERTLV